jgi:hypothetical protein
VRSGTAASTSAVCSTVVTIARAPLCATRYAMSFARSDAVLGTTSAPSLSAPTIAACHSGTRGSMTITGSPRRTPSPPSAFIMRFESFATSQNV